MQGLESQGGIDEGESLIRLTIAEALRAAGHLDEARVAATFARDRLHRIAAGIDSPALSMSFLERVSENVRTLALATDLVGA